MEEHETETLRAQVNALVNEVLLVKRKMRAEVDKVTVERDRLRQSLETERARFKALRLAVERVCHLIEAGEIVELRPITGPLRVVLDLIDRGLV